MSISIKPAEPVGAKIGDRVRWTNIHDENRFGVIHRVISRAVIVEDDNGHLHTISPYRLTLAPREWKVGDVVRNDDYTELPVCAIVRDHEDGEVVVKTREGWHQTEAHGYQSHLSRINAARTIIYLPEEA